MMEQQTFFLTKIMPLLFIIVGVTLFLVALRAFMVEKREGLNLSYKRLIIVSITSGLLVIIVLFSLIRKNSVQDNLSSFAPLRITTEVSDETSPKSPPTMNLWDKLVNLKSKIEYLDEAVVQFKAEIDIVEPPKNLGIKSEIPKIEQAINQLKTTENKIREKLSIFSPQTTESPKKSNKPKTIEGTPPIKQKTQAKAIPNWLLLIAALLMLIGTLSLFLTGGRLILVGRKMSRFQEKINRKDKPKDEKIVPGPLENLNRLARLVDRNQYLRALDIAKKIDKNELEMLDRLDFCYLKSFCIVQILIPYSPGFTKGSLKLPSLSPEINESYLSEAMKTLGEVLDSAPRMAEAQYLMGVILTIRQEYRKALEIFNKAQENLSSNDVDFKAIKSFCLLKLADELFMKDDNEGANKLFDEVVTLEVFKDRIPGILVKNRLLSSMKKYKEGKIEEARKGLESIAQVAGIAPDQKKLLEITIESLEIMLLFTEKRIKETLRNTTIFLKKWTPPRLPEPDDKIADELKSNIGGESDLPFSAAIFRAFYFLQAVVMLRLKEEQKRLPSKEETELLARPLLRALQFEPRNPDLLACLGSLYLLFLPHKRKKALEWLQAADNLGVENDYIRSLLEKYGSIEAERKNILDRLATLSARFLADGSVNASIKQELVKELGQFHEFRPILIELGDLGDIQQKSPTLQSLLNRVEYLSQLCKDINQSEIITEKEQILAITHECAGLVKVIEAASMQLEAFEKQIMKEIGKHVLQ